MKSNFLEKYGMTDENLPLHVAIIMDGNGRWAKKRFMNRIKGHEKGSEIVRTIVTTSREAGIKVLTLYAFSTENWDRPRPEVTALMGLLKRFISSERDLLKKKGIRLMVLGQKYRLPDDVNRELDITLDETKHNQNMVLNLALSYGGGKRLSRL